MPRVPPKVKKYRAVLRKIYKARMEIATKHIHASQQGEVEPGTPAEASAPPLPAIPGFSDVRLQLEMQELHQELIVSRWSAYATYSPPNGLGYEVTTTGMTLTTMDDDTVVGQVSFFDAPNLLEQIRSPR